MNEPEESSPATDPAGAAILSTATQLVITDGLDGFSMEAIAQHAHVSKATIYRRWPSRDDLILAVCAQLKTPGSPPSTGHLLSDLRVILADLCELLNSPLSQVMAALADAAERDEALDDLMRTVGTRARSRLIQVLSDGVERGELAAATEPQQLADLLVGPLFYRRFFRRARIDAEQAIIEAEALVSRHTAP